MRRTAAISLSMASTVSSSMTVFEVMDRIAVASRDPSSANTILPGLGQCLSARLTALSRQRA